jgi:hypothetical protein
MVSSVSRFYIDNSMKWKWRVRPLLCGLITGVLATGCSTYEAHDIYQPIDAVPLGYQSESLSLVIGFDPDTRFYSTGIAGVPIFPTVIQATDSKTIRLAIEMRLRDQLDFSFAPNPCLIIDDAELLCPHMVEVNTRAMFQDDGTMYADGRPRWNKIDEFYDSPVLSFAPRAAAGGVRITPTTIYEHLAYLGTPQWGFLIVNLAFEYRCEPECPQHFKFDVTGLVIVEDLPMPSGLHSFKLTRQADYTGLAGE